MWGCFIYFHNFARSRMIAFASAEIFCKIYCTRHEYKQNSRSLAFQEEGHFLSESLLMKKAYIQFTHNMNGMAIVERMSV